MPLENSAQTAQDPSASAPLAESGERTAGEVAGKAETREEKAQAEGNKAEHEGNQAEHEGNKAETKAPPSFRSTNIPGEAVIVTIVPRQFTMTTTKLWSAMKATDVKAITIHGAKIKSNAIFRYFQSFKNSIGPVEFDKLFPPEEAPTFGKKQGAKTIEKPADLPAGKKLTGTKNDSQVEVSIVGGLIVEEKPSSIVEGSIVEEKPTEKPKEAVERTGRDVLANPKIPETAAAQALRKAQGKEASALCSTTIPSE